jgi:hypothetical protein
MDGTLACTGSVTWFQSFSDHLNCRSCDSLLGYFLLLYFVAFDQPCLNLLCSLLSVTCVWKMLSVELLHAVVPRKWQSRELRAEAQQVRLLATAVLRCGSHGAVHTASPETICINRSHVPLPQLLRVNCLNQRPGKGRTSASHKLNNVIISSSGGYLRHSFLPQVRRK